MAEVEGHEANWVGRILCRHLQTDLDMTSRCWPWTGNSIFVVDALRGKDISESATCRGKEGTRQKKQSGLCSTTPGCDCDFFRLDEESNSTIPSHIPI